MPEPATVTGLISLAVTNVSALIFILLRDRKRNKKEDGKNGQIGEIKQAVDQANEKMNTVNNLITEVKGDVRGIKEHCTKTTMAFAEEIKNNREKIFDIVKEK